MSRLLSSLGLGQSNSKIIVGISAAGAVWQSAAQEWEFELTNIQDSSHATASMIQKVQHRIKSMNSAPITWLASPDLLPTWVQTPSQGVRNLKELHALAQARATQLFGMPNGSSWLLSANWHHAQPFLCSAAAAHWAQSLNGELTSSLHLLLQHAETQLDSDTWLAIATNAHLHLIYRQNKRWTHLRILRLAHSMTNDELVSKIHDEWQRESLKTAHPGGQLQWLSTWATQNANSPTNIKKISLKALVAHKPETPSITNLKTPNTELQALAQEVQWAQKILRAGK